jgi:hypothetical protein
MKVSIFKMLVLSCFLLLGINVRAQYAGASYSTGPSQMEILQVENRELSTMVYMAYTTPDTDDWNQVSSWMNFGDKTYIQIDGSKKQYHMISTINMPINSEAENRYMLFDRRNQRHQFILEFEKIPEGKSFDIIEDLNNPNAFNFYGVSYAPTDSTNYINVDEFIADYPVKEFGAYAIKGTTVYYVKFKDVVVNAVLYYLDEYGKYYNVNLSIQNYSNRSILFNPNNVFVEGYKYKKTKTNGVETYIPEQVDLELLSYADYDKIVKKKQRWNNFWVALGEGMAAYGAGQSSTTSTYSGSAYTNSNAHASGYVGNTYGYANAYGSSYTTVYGQSTTHSYNGAAAYAAQQQANANYANYVENQRQIRQQLGDGYVKLNTIPAETEYSGYFNIKYKKLNSLLLRIVIDGETYPFSF